MILYVRRHAPTAWNQQKIIQGREDIPLLESSVKSLSEEQIPAQIQSLKCYTSPLSRTMQTATALGFDPVPTQALIEMDWGEWSGQNLKSLRRGDPDGVRKIEARGVWMQPPGGECPKIVADRVIEWLKGAAFSEDCCLVTHKGVIRAMLSAALNWDMQAELSPRPDWQQWQRFEFHSHQLHFIGEGLL